MLEAAVDDGAEDLWFEQEIAETRAVYGYVRAFYVFGRSRPLSRRPTASGDFGALRRSLFILVVEKIVVVSHFHSESVLASEYVQNERAREPTEHAATNRRARVFRKWRVRRRQYTCSPPAFYLFFTHFKRFQNQILIKKIAIL